MRDRDSCADAPARNGNFVDFLRELDGLDADPGGPALCDTPFLSGWARMRKREDAIYDASAFGREMARERAGRPSGGGEGGAHARQAEETAAVLILRQREEQEAFATAIAGAVELVLSEEGVALCMRSSEEWNACLESYAACVREEGMGWPAFFGMDRHCGLPDADARLKRAAENVGQSAASGELPWRHPLPLEETPAKNRLFPSWRLVGKRYGRFPENSRGDTKDAGKGARLLFQALRFLRMAALGVFLVLGYLVLTGRGCLPPQ